ncbi:hypothetical protein [Actinomadura madurae]|uniref:hypothetical protein n=1 Tax=Actinomadura madurae TaxID=1993 RepID=UPI0020D23FB8|nr:hypothetical protein [Actinomadura madurae]MCQ0004874.1 hypothetical protein [Actinomadura madurae]
MVDEMSSPVARAMAAAVSTLLRGGRSSAGPQVLDQPLDLLGERRPGRHFLGSALHSAPSPVTSDLS